MHFSNSYYGAAPYFGGSYIGTEFFFIVSGFFLMYSYLNKKESYPIGTGAFRYTLNKIKKLYPHYLFSFLVIFIFTMIINKAGFLKIVNDFCASFWELIFLQISGLKCTGLVNYPAWYISAMLIAGYFLYCLLEFFNNKFVRFGIPFVLLFVYAFFSKNAGNMDVWGGAQIYNLSDAVVRAFAAMSIGVLCFEGAQALQTRKVGTSLKIILTMLELLCFIIVLVKGTLIGHSQNDFYLIALLGIGIMLSFSELTATSQICKAGIFAYLGKISYPMFLNQLFIIGMFNQFYTGKDYKITLLLYLAVLIIYSCLTELIIRSIKKVFAKAA